jgi:NAD+ synthase (glutamine-hydrolysing)
MTLKLAIAQLNFVVGDMPATRKKIVDAARQAYAQGARLVLTPELSIAAMRRRTCSCVPPSSKPVMMP